MRLALDITLIVLAAALLVIGILTYPDIHPGTVLAMAAVGLALLVPVPARRTEQPEVPTRT